MIAVLELVLFALLTCAVFVLSSVTEPRRARCPDGTYLHTGVRTDGRFECARSLIGPENDAAQPPGVLHGKVYCNPTQPVVLDHRTVGCQRGRS